MGPSRRAPDPIALGPGAAYYVAAMSRPETGKPRVLLLHNFLVPYRVPLFAELATRFNLDVWILGDVRRVRDWPRQPGQDTFSWRLLPNLAIPLGSRYNVLLFNYTLPCAMARHRHDVVICCAWDTPAAFYAAAHARVTGTPFVLWSGSTSREPTRLRVLTKPLVRLLVRSATAWLAYGTRAKAYLAELGADPSATYCAYNTVDLRHFAQKPDEAAAGRLREDLGLGDRKVILYCGNLLDLKGVGGLIEAFAAFSAERPDVALVLAGSGRDEPKYRAMVRTAGLDERVVFAGFVPADDVVRYYALADLLAVPSRRDVWGLVINEALAAGVPVLATDAPGASADLLRSGENGYVVAAGSPGALTDAMRRHFSAESSWPAMREAARESIRPFSIEAAADAFEEAVAHALKRD